MTWSLIARDGSAAFGIVVATKNFAVGCRVPFLKAGVGAVTTQALVNPFYGARGLPTLELGVAPYTVIRALVDADDGVSLELARGSTLGIVGESGSGKSVTSLAVMGLLPNTAEVSGHVTFDGISLLDLADRPLRDLRGDRLAMIFQEPMTSLNPS